MTVILAETEPAGRSRRTHSPTLRSISLSRLFLAAATAAERTLMAMPAALGRSTSLNGQGSRKNADIEIPAVLFRPAEQFPVKVDDERRVGLDTDMTAATDPDRGMVGRQIAGEHARKIAEQLPPP